MQAPERDAESKRRGEQNQGDCESERLSYANKFLTANSRERALNTNFPHVNSEDTPI